MKATPSNLKVKLDKVLTTNRLLWMNCKIMQVNSCIMHLRESYDLPGLFIQCSFTKKNWENSFDIWRSI